MYGVGPSEISEFRFPVEEREEEDDQNRNRDVRISATINKLINKDMEKIKIMEEEALHRTVWRGK